MLRYYLEDSKHAHEEQRLKLRILNSLITSCRSSDAQTQVHAHSMTQHCLKY